MVLDIISIGDVTEDVFVEVKQAHTHQDKNKSLPDLCLPFGTKIALERVDKLLGGNAGNVAIGSARLSLSSALYTEVGDDDIGTSLLNSLQKNKVSTRYFLSRKRQKSNYSVILAYHGERTILVHHEPRTYHFPQAEAAKYVYLTSLGPAGKKLFPSLLYYLQKNNSRLCFNPGTHQLALGLKRLYPLLQQTTVLFVNVEEAQQLLKEKNSHPKRLLSKLHHAGPKIIVITDGEHGSYAFDGNNYYFCPIYPVKPIERTGCGDAYSTGFLCALFYNRTIPEAMQWGSVNAASVLQYIGPQAGLLKLSLLEKVLMANPKFTVQELNGVRSKMYKPKRFKDFR